MGVKGGESDRDQAAHNKIVSFTQVYKQFVENESFRRFVGGMVCAITG
jgi:hypothetical protein